MNYPSFICTDCGLRYGKRKPNPHATWHEAPCDICGNFTFVTEPRDFGHLNASWQNHNDS